jgi:hypothetical protein
MALADCIAHADVLLADRAGEIARVWSAAAGLTTSRKNFRATR